MCVCVRVVFGLYNKRLCAFLAKGSDSDVCIYRLVMSVYA